MTYRLRLYIIRLSRVCSTGVKPSLDVGIWGKKETMLYCHNLTPLSQCFLIVKDKVPHLPPKPKERQIFEGRRNLLLITFRFLVKQLLVFLEATSCGSYSFFSWSFLRPASQGVASWFHHQLREAISRVKCNFTTDWKGFLIGSWLAI